MSGITFAVLASTALLLGLVAVMGALLVVNTNRRHRYRADMAEQGLLQRQAVMQAEREAVEHTMRGIGRELHDNVGQLLAVAFMGLSAAIEDEGGNARLEAAQSALHQGIDEVRRLGHTLNSDMWELRSFSDALSTECERIERTCMVRMHLLLQGEPPRLTPEAKTILFRVFQEAVANALKHANAKTITVSLIDGEAFRFSIADDGKGIGSEQARTGSGLNNIRRRCELIGFHAELSTVPGEGTRWLFTQRNGTDAA